MPIIRIKLKDKRQFFVSEKGKGISLMEGINDAFDYQGTLEFKLSWKLLGVNINEGTVDYTFHKRDVLKFEAIDKHSLVVTPFELNDIEIDIGKELYIDSITFRQLIECGITSSHFVYNKEDKWIGFPKIDDYPRVGKIRYYARGLRYTIHADHSWVRRYDEHSWHSSYEPHHKCMLNPTIQQINLLNLDPCHEFIIYEQKLS